MTILKRHFSFLVCISVILECAQFLNSTSFRFSVFLICYSASMCNFNATATTTTTKAMTTKNHEIELEATCHQFKSQIDAPHNTKPFKASRKSSFSSLSRNRRNVVYVSVISACTLLGLLWWILTVREEAPNTTISFLEIDPKTNIYKSGGLTNNAFVITQNEYLHKEEDDSEYSHSSPELSDESDGSASISDEPGAVMLDFSPVGAVFGSQEYLQKADSLIERAMSAILAEYGQAALDYGNYHVNMIPPMFAWAKVDLNNATRTPDEFRRNRGNGGWTSQRSWKGLVSRLIQAMSTRSEFTVVLGGHSAAAGHGNHFKQSYLMQFHKVLEPIFHQLSVKLISRNQAQGGLGTVQSSLGFSSIYGSDIDLMLWDSGKAERLCVVQGASLLISRVLLSS
jgi:hypothetical protein